MTKFALSRHYAYDEDRAEEGVWVPFKGDVEFKLRHFGSRKSRDVREDLERPHVAAIKRDAASEELMEELAIEQLARAIIVDWKGVKDMEGNDIPCTYDNRKALVSDKSMKALVAEIIQVAIDNETFNAGLDEELEKNSETS